MLGREHAVLVFPLDLLDRGTKQRGKESRVDVATGALRPHP